MSWQRELTLHGRDPDEVKDADTAFPFVIPDDPMFLKGCVIGEPCHCSAAKAIVTAGARWTWVGAHVCIIEHADGRLCRYTHRGVIPKTQDRLVMPPPGTYSMGVPRPSVRLGQRNHHEREGTAPPRPNAGRRVAVLSTAGELRR